MLKNKKWLIVLAILFVSAIIAMAYFYRAKIVSAWNDPEKFIRLFLDASQITQLTFLSLFTGLSLSIAAVLIDLITLGWKKSGLRRLLIKPSGSAKVDLWCYFLSVFKIYEVLYFVLTMGIFYFVAGLALHYFNFNLAQYISNQYLQFALVFLVVDFNHYIAHRFMHIKPFWELHAYHHSAEEFNLLTTSRGHLLEAAIYNFISGLFFVLMGAPILSVVLVYALREMYQYLLHSDVNWKLGWIGKWILISPAAHRLHHSIDTKDFNKNYSTFFIWWDKLLGTYAEPKDKIKIGIENNPYNKMGFFKGQWEGVKRFCGMGK